MTQVGARIEVTGVAGVRRQLAAWGDRMDRACERAVADSTSVVHQALATTLSLKTHPPGTKTNSLPGEPPARVTGHLIRSIEREPRSGVTRVSRGVYLGGVTPRAVYARIQDKGGITGAGYRTHLPPRPYIGPAARMAAPAVRRVFVVRLNEAARLA